MISRPPFATRSDTTATRLRQEIIGGATAPGTLLAESAVARRLGVSRVPVREALFALERDGLVEFSKTGRAYVKALTPQDFEELFALRLALEPMAARLAAANLRHDAAGLEENIRETKRAKSVSAITRLDLEFHEIILQGSGSTRLLRLWCSLRGELELWLGQLHRLHHWQTSKTREQTVESHQEILQAFREFPAADCERLLRRHIIGWREWLPIPSGQRPNEEVAE